MVVYFDFYLNAAQFEIANIKLDDKLFCLVFKDLDCSKNELCNTKIMMNEDKLLENEINKSCVLISTKEDNSSA